MPLAPGSRLGPYEIVAQLGAGGMGEVYRAVDSRLHRTVAIKVLPPDRFHSFESEQRFLQEARAASTLNHSNIVTVYDIAREHDVSFLVMEHVPGEPLTRAIPPKGMPQAELLEYGAQIADALATAHRAGIVHRDIKPANLMVTPHRQIKILDFGLAKLQQAAAGADDATRTVRPDLTEPGVVMGTASYMSPEQARGEPVDARTDLFAFGAVLYEMATGRRAFPRPLDWTRPSDPTTSPEIDRIILKLLDPDPDLRYQTAADALADLKRLRAPSAPASRSRWRAATIAGITVCAIVAGGIAWRRFGPLFGDSRLSDGNHASPNREANSYYEKALLFGGGGVEDNGQRIRMLERALALDPGFAAARAEYAFSGIVTILAGDSSDPTVFYKTEEQIRQALRDDPECSRAHAVLALTYLMEGHKDLVPPEIDLALKFNPNDMTAYTWRLQYDQMNGDYPEAIRIARELIRRWPLYWPGHTFLADLLYEQGDADGAVRELELALEQDPHSVGAFMTLARIRADTGDLRMARHEYERIPAGNRKNIRARLLSALLLALEARREDARRELDEGTLAYAALIPDAAVQAAEIYAVLGDTTSALQWLGRAVRAGDERDSWFRRDPHLASIKSLPEFQTMLASVTFRREQRAQASSKPR